jgi:hypothetical protein
VFTDTNYHTHTQISEEIDLGPRVEESYPERSFKEGVASEIDTCSLSWKVMVEFRYIQPYVEDVKEWFG